MLERCNQGELSFSLGGVGQRIGTTLIMPVVRGDHPHTLMDNFA